MANILLIYTCLRSIYSDQDCLSSLPTASLQPFPQFRYHHTPGKPQQARVANIAAVGWMVSCKSSPQPSSANLHACTNQPCNKNVPFFVQCQREHISWQIVVVLAERTTIMVTWSGSVLLVIISWTSFNHTCPFLCIPYPKISEV